MLIKPLVTDRGLAEITQNDPNIANTEMTDASFEDENPLASDVEKLMSEFDLSGDMRMSPEEFFNVIMSLYE